jgi:5-methylcytosine-specific restriction protein A
LIYVELRGLRSLNNKKLGQQGIDLLKYLVNKLKSGEVRPGEEDTYISYSKAHKDLKLNQLGNTVGRSLEHQGLRDLAEWAIENGYPAITGIIINQDSYYPSKGYFEAYKKDYDDYAWWKNEIYKAKSFNWDLVLGHEIGTEAMVEPVYADEIREENIQLPEGAVRKVTVNSYERNGTAREICIMHYGFKCCVCGFEFENTYGDMGKNYIHVHHIVPVASIKREYKIDPIKDLRPVCPNCHAMLHRTNPPMQIEDLIKIISKVK